MSYPMYVPPVVVSTGATGGSVGSSAALLAIVVTLMFVWLGVEFVAWCMRVSDRYDNIQRALRGEVAWANKRKARTGWRNPKLAHCRNCSNFRQSRMHNMPERVNPIFEIETGHGQNSFLTVEADGHIRLECDDDHYSGKLSLTDSLGLAALVFARHGASDHDKPCVCGHRYGTHFGGGCGGAERPYHERFLAPPADLAHCNCTGFQAQLNTDWSNRAPLWGAKTCDVTGACCGHSWGDHLRATPHCCSVDECTCKGWLHS